MLIKDSVFLITGGNSGIGYQIIKYFLQQDAKIITIDLMINKIQKIKNKNLLYFECDITNLDRIKQIFKQSIQKFNKIDGIINCAGIAIAMKLISKNINHQLTPKIFQKIFQINVLGTFNIIRTYLDNFNNKIQTNGIIINISSIAAQDGQQGQTAYSMSKAALCGMTLPMSRELGKFNIRVVGVLPGIINTEMTKIMPENLRKTLVNQSSINRFGEPEEIAQFCISIIQNNYITGVNLRIDGGSILPKL